MTKTHKRRWLVCIYECILTLCIMIFLINYLENKWIISIVGFIHGSAIASNIFSTLVKNLIDELQDIE